MKPINYILVPALLTAALISNAQDLKTKEVPATVREALQKKYPKAVKVSWEKEKGNYEANWGGKSNEDNSVQFTPGGDFIEIVNAIPVSSLPKNAVEYIKKNYHLAKITEAGKITDAKGMTYYEAEVNRKDLLFDEKGNFIKVED